IAPGMESNAGRAALTRKTVHNHDVLADPQYRYGGVLVDPYRTVLSIPMMRADELLGVIMIYRHEVRPFSDSHVSLLETFADQAAIAIENARLLTELQAKNASLTESLAQQTATGEILRAISSPRPSRSCGSAPARPRASSRSSTPFSEAPSSCPELSSACCTGSMATCSI